MLYCWCDCETTNKKPNLADVIELAGMIVDKNKVLEEFMILMKPVDIRKLGKLNVQEALDVNHYTVQEIMTFPSAYQGMNEFIEILRKYDNGGYIMAGYNVVYDSTCIKNMLRKTSHNLKKENRIDFYDMFSPYPLDVYQLAIALRNMGMLPGIFNLENMKLSTLCEYYGIPIDAHRGLSDVRATRQLLIVLYRLMEKYFKKEK